MPMRSVILTLDGAVADRALPIVRETARRHGASVVLVQVGEATTELHALVAALRDEGIAAELEIHAGSPAAAADVVAEVARRRGGGLIVVATARPPQADHTPVPGLTRLLLRAASCPVVAVPAAA
jgi:nucleotide-binding universal stress UspA family protein